MKKTIIFILAALMVVTSSFAVCFAEDGASDDAATRAQITTCGFDRDSSTKGTASISHRAITVATNLKVTMTLQSAPFGSSTFTNAGQPNLYLYDSNTAIIGGCKSFYITTSKQYRVRFICEDVINGNTYTYTYYSNII